MEDILFTVQETAKLLKTNKNYVYGLVKTGLLPALKIGSVKVRKSSLLEFLQKYEGMDISEPTNVKELFSEETIST